jgi:hypothetical protein
VGVDPDGALLVRTSPGEPHRILAGDVLPDISRQS